MKDAAQKSCTFCLLKNENRVDAFKRRRENTKIIQLGEVMSWVGRQFRSAVYHEAAGVCLTAYNRRYVLCLEI